MQRRDAETIAQILRSSFRGLTTKNDDWVFNDDYARELLITHFKTQSLKGFGLEEFTIGVIAAGVIMHYLQETQKSNLLHIRKLSPFNIADHIVLDPSTKRNLEITSSIAGDDRGTLVHVLDRTSTPMGGRLLKRWITQPLNACAPILARLDAVSELVGNAELRNAVTAHLTQIGDLERLNSRICTARAGPRDLQGLRANLEEIAQLRGTSQKFTAASLRDVHGNLHPLPDIVELIHTAIDPAPPATLADGGVIKSGYDKDLDEVHQRKAVDCRPPGKRKGTHGHFLSEGGF